MPSATNSATEGDPPGTWLPAAGSSTSTSAGCARSSARVSVLSSDFDIDVVETDYVPNFDDPALTYDNLDDGTKRCKLLESCVLYVDIRDSSTISAERRPHTLARMYSAFVRSMIRCARFYDGHVRNIIGDRVMVVFDRDECFSHAVMTAALRNTVAQRVIDRRIPDFKFRCGIGIDFGKMLVVKAGAIRRGAETEFYRSLVWLGRPANVASKLTDNANKTTSRWEDGVKVGNYYPSLPTGEQWYWFDQTYGDFLDKLEPTFTPALNHKDKYFAHFFKTKLGPYKTAYPPILVTEAVWSGLRAEVGSAPMAGHGWSKQALTVPGYSGAIYGADIVVREDD